MIISLFTYAQTKTMSDSLINMKSDRYESYDAMRQKLLLTEIPPLDTLFASARKNNAIMLMSEMETEVAIREMKTERNNWWSYLRGFGTYQYGVMASLVDISQGGTPVNPQYSQEAQSWWNLGLSLNIPLNEFIDRPNRIKKEKARISVAQYNTEVKFDEIKVQIAQAYSEAILSLTLSQALYDRYIFAKSSYEVLETEFFAGRTDSSALSDAKAKEIDAYVQLQEKLSNLIYYASILETLSKITIVNY